MTHNLHNMYFKGINYYLIGEGGGRGGDKLADGPHPLHTLLRFFVRAAARSLRMPAPCTRTADSRMTQDLNTVVNAFTKTFSETSFLLSTGAFCPWFCHSRQRDCHFAGTPSSSLLKRPPKGEGGAAE